MIGHPFIDQGIDNPLCLVCREEQNRPQHFAASAQRDQTPWIAAHCSDRWGKWVRDQIGAGRVRGSIALALDRNWRLIPWLWR